MTARPRWVSEDGQVYCGNTYGHSACTLHLQILSPQDEDLGTHIRDIWRVSGLSYSSIVSVLDEGGPDKLHPSITCKN